MIPAGIGALLALMMFATLSLAMRIPSRARIAEAFRSRDREPALTRFARLQPQFMLATAVLRNVSKLALFFIILFLVLGENDAIRPDRSLIPALAACLVVVLVFDVALPNAIAKYFGEALLVRSMHILETARLLCFPLIRVLQGFDTVVRRLAGVPESTADSRAEELQREILDAVNEMQRSGAVDVEARDMIEAVIELRDTLVEEIMTPRTEVAAIARNASYDEAVRCIREKGHSRIPVYDGTIDTIVGILYAKDLLGIDIEQPFSLDPHLRRPLFVPESKPVRKLLEEFKDQKVHIAVVLDEYGGMAGVVTIEDILEEVVGEITDEYDPVAPEGLRHIDDSSYEVDARFRIADLNDELEEHGVELPEDEDYETVAGFILARLGRVPRVGESCEHENVVIRILGAEPRRITRVRIDIRKEQPAAGA